MSNASRFRRPAVILAIATVILFGLIGLVYEIVGNPLDPFDDQRFSSRRLQQISPSDGERRARMARSALQNHLTPGTTEAQVTAKFGPPDGISTGPEDDGGNKLPGVRTYVYMLGSWSGVGFDDAFLYVHLDARDRVIAAQNTQLRSRMKGRGQSPEYVEVDSGFAQRLPAARAKVFRRIEEFFNLTLYDYKVKVGPTKELK